MQAEAPSVAAEILLLEPNIDETDVIRQATDSSNVSVVAACPDILSFLRQEGTYSSAPRPDLILLDLDLSKIEDCEILTEIKKDQKFRRIPVVVLASSEKYEDIFQAYDLHANAYICKPADRREFVKVIRTTLQFWLTLVRLPRD